VKTVPHGKYLGRDADDIAQNDADHFVECPACGELFDMRDLGQVFEHIHDGPVCEQVQ
jgi:uncharacterized C2H2 Zn-finger protein